MFETLKQLFISYTVILWWLMMILCVCVCVCVCVQKNKMMMMVLQWIVDLFLIVVVCRFSFVFVSKILVSVLFCKKTKKNSWFHCFGTLRKILKDLGVRDERLRLRLR